MSLHHGTRSHSPIDTQTPKKKAERKGGEDEENHKEKHQNKSLLFSLTRPLASDTWSMQCECAKRPREMNKHTPNTVAVHLQHTPIPAAVPLHCIPPVQLSLSPGRMLDVTVLSSFIFFFFFFYPLHLKRKQGSGSQTLASRAMMQTRSNNTLRGCGNSR